MGGMLENTPEFRKKTPQELFDKSLRLGLVHPNSAEVEYYYGPTRPNVIYFTRDSHDRAAFARSMIPVQSDQLMEAARQKAQVAMDRELENSERRERRREFPHAAE